MMMMMTIRTIVLVTVLKTTTIVAIPLGEDLPAETTNLLTGYRIIIMTTTMMMPGMLPIHPNQDLREHVITTARTTMTMVGMPRIPPSLDRPGVVEEEEEVATFVHVTHPGPPPGTISVEGMIVPLVDDRTELRPLGRVPSTCRH